MSFVFSLRRAFDNGCPVGAAKVFLSARGVLSYGEERDERFHRVVRTAKFTRIDGGEPIPVLRNADPLMWNGQLFVITGVEEVADDKLARPRLLGQTWQMVPEPLEELIRADLKIARLVYRLRQAGVVVDVLPGGNLRIEGEVREDGEPVHSPR
jgi:hypothetical protein